MYILDSNSLLGICTVNVLFQPMALLFIFCFLSDTFKEQKVLISMNLISLLFFMHSAYVLSKKVFLSHSQKTFMLCFFLEAV